MTVADVAMETDETELVMFPTVRLLKLIKDAQQRHGLRHADYERYRKYCASKLKRQRRVLKFTNTHKCTRRHKAKFVKKWLTEATFTSEGFLQLGVFGCERSWARAMADKIAIEDNPEKGRKKFSMRMNLKRAVTHAKHLEQLVRESPKCDATTKLEVQAYSAWLVGICSFEMKQWHDAAEALKTARTVYEGLAEATHNTSLSNMYKAKCREIQPQLRLCEFNSAEAPSPASMSELMALRLQIGGDESVDKLIAEVRSKAAKDEVVVVEWAGERITIEEEKVSQVVQSWKQTASEIQECSSAKDKMAIYEKQLADTRDAIEKLGDLMKRKTAENADTTSLQTLKTYVEFLKLNGTISRYVAMIENTKTDKKYKPQDLLRLYDSVIELCKECVELPGAAVDQTLIKAYNAKIEYFRTFRCYYMAASYAHLAKFFEAITLFEQAERRLNTTNTLLEGLKSDKFFDETVSKKSLEELRQKMKVDKVSVKSKRLFEASNLKSNEENRVLSSCLASNVDAWNNVCLDKKANEVIPIAQIPPSFIPMANKPLFFDLALNHIKMPDLHKRLAVQAEAVKPTVSSKNISNQEKDSSISGMMKGWIWGKK
ncbi:unnamed protein product [Auanema sp. JU1783]|nr:unnamed protein product [Auanema sp. JU1783]